MPQNFGLMVNEKGKTVFFDQHFGGHKLTEPFSFLAGNAFMISFLTHFFRGNDGTTSFDMVFSPRPYLL